MRSRSTLFDADDGSRRIDGGRLHGLSVGDSLDLIAQGETLGVRATVERVFDDNAIVTFESEPEGLVPGSVAVRRSHRPRTVSLAPEARALADLVVGIEQAPWLDLVSGEPRGDIHIDRSGDGLVWGRGRRPMAADPPGIRALVRELDDWARARVLWPLLHEATGFGDPPWLPWSARVKVRSGTRAPRDLEPGETLYEGDALFVEASHERIYGFPIYVNVIDHGIAGCLELINYSEPSGVQLQPEERESIGKFPGCEPGLPLAWPSRMEPLAEGGLESLAVVASVRALDLRPLLRAGPSMTGMRSSTDRAGYAREAADYEPLLWDAKFFQFRLVPGSRP